MKRGIKTKEELDTIKKACTITDTIFSRILGNFNMFTTEKDVADFIQTQAKKYAEDVSFSPVVAAGANAAAPHHKPNETTLHGFVVIDLGVLYKGQCSDMTRTLYVGTPTFTERSRYDTVVKSLEEIRVMTAHGVRCNDIDAKGREMLGVMKKQCIHAIGHGIGKKVHEYPYIKPNSRYYMKEGMVFTLEPGVYKKREYGIRIEDTCLLTKAGCVALTRSPKDLLVLPASHDQTQRKIST